jgi:hypothetical protein
MTRRVVGPLDDGLRSMHGTAPRTLWQPLRQGARAPAGDEGLDALLRLAREAIAQGHRRVATQRLLMLRERDAALPDEFVRYCDNVLATLPAWQRRRMRRAASDWAALCGGAQRAARR